MAFASLMVVQLAVLWRLPYRRADIFAASLTQVAAPPNPDFSIGRLRWPVDELSREPALAAFRQDFRQNCGSASGLDAATCIATMMAKKMPFADPPQDLFSAHFDPAEDFARRLAGAPANCVTRSGILVNELLSVGNPARLVQIQLQDGKGHNVAEIWDDRQGWVLFDATYGGVLAIGNRPASAATAVRSMGFLSVLGGAPAMVPDADSFYRASPTAEGAFLYPSPWLHLRIGESGARWPFRAEFGRIGKPLARTGVAQDVLRVGVLVCFFAELLLLAMALFRSSSTARVVVEASAPLRFDVVEGSRRFTRTSSNIETESESTG